MAIADMKKQHKQIKKQVQVAEKIRNDDRSWKSKEELIKLKKQKLSIKDNIKRNKNLDIDQE